MPLCLLLEDRLNQRETEEGIPVLSHALTGKRLLQRFRRAGVRVQAFHRCGIRDGLFELSDEHGEILPEPDLFLLGQGLPGGGQILREKAPVQAAEVTLRDEGKNLSGALRQLQGSAGCPRVLRADAVQNPCFQNFRRGNFRRIGNLCRAGRLRL